MAREGPLCLNIIMDRERPPCLPIIIAREGPKYLTIIKASERPPCLPIY
jgi:hypothetical protein